MAWEWVPSVTISLVAGVASGALAYWRSTSVAISVIESRIAAMARDDIAMSVELHEAAKELHAVISEVSAMNREQGVVNRVTEIALKSIVDRLDMHERRCSDCRKDVAEGAATISLLREIMERKDILQK